MTYLNSQDNRLKDTLIWLKIRNRNNDDFVFSHLNYWLGMFSQYKENIIIYSEDLNLPKKYSQYNTLSRKDLDKTEYHKQIMDKLNYFQLAEGWKKAGTALMYPTFYKSNTDYKYAINIDADDILVLNTDIKAINLALSLTESFPTLSYDLNFSNHVAFGHIVKHHWSFGLNVQNRALMKEAFLKAPAPFPVSWGVNIDHVISEYLLNHTSEKEAMAFVHEKSIITHGKIYRGYYNKKDDSICVEYEDKFFTQPRHSRTVVINENSDGFI